MTSLVILLFEFSFQVFCERKLVHVECFDVLCFCFFFSCFEGVKNWHKVLVCDANG